MEPYKKIKAQDIYIEKKSVKGRIVAILDLVLEERELSLIIPQSRALQKGEIHEIIFTEEEKGPGETVNKVGYIGFFEVDEGGLAIVGDVLEIGGIERAKLIGFNETHMPNHQNIVFLSHGLFTGKTLGIKLGDEVEIKKKEGKI